MREIFERRSVREFLPEAVGEEAVERLLRAAMQAPSAGNGQPWEFVVIRDREAMKAVKDFHPYAMALDTAPLAVLVCGNTKRQKFPIEGYWAQDCAACTENLLLEAVHLGLGSVWMGVYPRPERVEGCRMLFRLPEHILPLCIVAIGKPKAAPESSDRFDPERIHREIYGQ